MIWYWEEGDKSKSHKDAYGLKYLRFQKSSFWQDNSGFEMWALNEPKHEQNIKKTSVFQNYFTEITLLGLIYTEDKIQDQLLTQGCVSVSVKP